MTDGCGVDCECADGECLLGSAFAFGVTTGLMLADSDE